RSHRWPPECGDKDPLIRCASQRHRQIGGRAAFSAIRHKEGSSQYWTAIQVRNHGLPILRLELRKNGAWTVIPREPYNDFVASGRTLEDILPPVSAGIVAPGTAQLR